VDVLSLGIPSGSTILQVGISIYLAPSTYYYGHILIDNVGAQCVSKYLLRCYNYPEMEIEKLQIHQSYEHKVLNYELIK
jgi:hypothetical protein